MIKGFDSKLAGLKNKLALGGKPGLAQDQAGDKKAMGEKPMAEKPGFGKDGFAFSKPVAKESAKECAKQDAKQDAKPGVDEKAAYWKKLAAEKLGNDKPGLDKIEKGEKAEAEKPGFDEAHVVQEQAIDGPEQDEATEIAATEAEAE